MSMPINIARDIQDLMVVGLLLITGLPALCWMVRVYLERIKD